MEMNGDQHKKVEDYSFFTLFWWTMSLKDTWVGFSVKCKAILSILYAEFLMPVFNCSFVYLLHLNNSLKWETMLAADEWLLFWPVVYFERPLFHLSYLIECFSCKTNLSCCFVFCFVHWPLSKRFLLLFSYSAVFL